MVRTLIKRYGSAAELERNPCGLRDGHAPRWIVVIDPALVRRAGFDAVSRWKPSLVGSPGRRRSADSALTLG